MVDDFSFVRWIDPYLWETFQPSEVALPFWRVGLFHGGHLLGNRTVGYFIGMIDTTDSMRGAMEQAT
jgi:hypothetical protein